MSCVLILLSILFPLEYPKHTSAVLLQERTEVTVQKLDLVQTKKYRRVLVLNKQGENLYGEFSRHYNGYTKIKRLEAKVLDVSGSLLLGSKHSSVVDVALDVSNSGITDSRVKSISFSKHQLTPPYIIEFISEEETNQSFFYEDWSPVTTSNVWVKSSSYTFRAPLDMNYRTRGLNLKDAPVKEKGRDYVQETWILKDYLPFPENASFAPNSLPMLYVKPGDYKIGNYNGKVTSWNDIGQFYLKLNEGRDKLPETTRYELQQALKGLSDPLDRAKEVYAFMQKRTRYFNVSFKLGGWQSVPVEQVATRGYGDCKGLTSFTLALLKEAGIPAYPALVSAGSFLLEEELDDFPTTSFNHIIACVPLAKDTLWLECTSQTAPPGYLGTFTGNRKALLVTEKGSRLVRTQSYTAEDNRRDTQMNIILQPTGAVSAKYTKTYSGTFLEQVWDLPTGKEAQRNYLKKGLRYNDPSFSSYEWIKRDSTVREEVAFEADWGANVAGSRLFLQIFPWEAMSFPEEEVHQEGFYISPHTQSMSESVEVVVESPQGYSIETPLKDVKVSFDFGTYTYSFRVEAGRLHYTRKVIVHAGTYPAAQHPNWLDFTKGIQKMDRLVIVYKKI
jgi:transglutaminase-like putative cysteine protease